MQIEIQSRYAKTYKTEAGLQREVSRLEEIATAHGEHLRWIQGVADNGNHAIVILLRQNSRILQIFLTAGHTIAG